MIWTRHLDLSSSATDKLCVCRPFPGLIPALRVHLAVKPLEGGFPPLFTELPNPGLHLSHPQVSFAPADRSRSVGRHHVFDDQHCNTKTHIHSRARSRIPGAHSCGFRVAGRAKPPRGQAATGFRFMGPEASEESLKISKSREESGSCAPEPSPSRPLEASWSVP